MSEDWETQKEIEDSLKVCREIQTFLKREKKEGVPDMNLGTRTEIDRIIKSLQQEEQPVIEQPAVAQPVVKQPDVAQPVAEQPVVKQPDIAQPVVAQPVSAQPEPETEEEKIPEKESLFKPEPEQQTVVLEPAKEGVQGVGVVKPWKPITITELDAEPETETKSSGKEEAEDGFPFKDVSGDIDESYNETHPFLRAVLRILICVLLALLFAIVITKFVAHHTSVEGSSMETTLENGDQLIVENVSYYFHDPERFDVVVFPYNDDVNYIKRIIGLPGETVQIRDGMIYINGEYLEENYGREDMEDPGLAAEEIQLGPDEYFVLGDNRNASVDSRKPEVGAIKRSNIKGKAWLRFYPMDQISFVE